LATSPLRGHRKHGEADAAVAAALEMLNDDSQGIEKVDAEEEEELYVDDDRKNIKTKVEESVRRAAKKQSRGSRRSRGEKPDIDSAASSRRGSRENWSAESQTRHL